jgi:hypothetical protein
MLAYASAFSADKCNWNTAAVASMDYMLYNAIAFKICG